MSELERIFNIRLAYDCNCIGVQPCAHGSENCKPGTGGSLPVREGSEAAWTWLESWDACYKGYSMSDEPTAPYMPKFGPKCMCHPDLTRGMCCICFGALTPDNIYTDNDGVQWDHHRGTCAVLAGFYPDERSAAKAQQLIDHMHSLPHSSNERAQAVRDYYRFVSEVSTEDFYNTEAP